MVVRKAESRLATHGPGLTFGLLFLLANAALFWWGVVKEYNVQTGFRRYSSVIARGAGYTMNLNIGIILLLGSRKFMTIMRQTPLNLIFPFDEAMPKYHGIIGYVTFVLAAVHGVFHVIPGVITAQGLPALWSGGFAGWTFSVVTGFVAMLVYTIMIVALRARKSRFELFFNTHLIGAAIFIIIIILHGKLFGVLYTYKWITAPIAIYLIDRCYRNWHTHVLHATMPGTSETGFGGGVLKLAVPKCFEYRAGQYVDVMIPSISRTQWHPYTIASAPHEPQLIFYIKVVGDWTAKLNSQLQDIFAKGRQETMEVHVRGPYGAPAQHVGQFDSVVLISGGIGSTPFCSIIKSAVYEIEKYSPGEVSHIRHANSDYSSANCSMDSLCRKRPANTDFVKIPMHVAMEADRIEAVPQKDLLNISVSSLEDLNPIGSFSSITDSEITSKSKSERFHNELNTIAVTYGSLWLTIIRYFTACIVLITFDGFNMSQTGFRVFPRAFLIVDLVLASFAATPVLLSIVLDLIRIRQVFLFDILVSMPVLTTPIVFHILCLFGVASESWHAYPKVFFYGLFPAAGLVLCLRHVKRAGEFSKLAPTRHNDIAKTRSLDFICTTPTSEADDWLVRELEPLSHYKHFHMHRFITRESKPESESCAGSESGVGRFENNYGRPDWNELFERMVWNVRSESSIGMFFCGSPGMEENIRDAAKAVMLRSRKRSRENAKSHLKEWGCSVRIMVKAENF